jgi:hypothetical protein
MGAIPVPTFLAFDNPMLFHQVVPEEVHQAMEERVSSGCFRGILAQRHA